MTDVANKNKRKALFKGVFFWSIPVEDFEEARKVWEVTKQLTIEGEYDRYPSMKNSTVAHVRPHARDKTDCIEAPDGSLQIKKCFWLNAQYLTSLVTKYL
ncbi:hypothetical protein TALC_00933 [Thermoplasmatales archaeon BRNA1]|nr:hypothetical protein TALC_00933 [Thermoplasmatales archaeon BRNA1]